jgi:hypothetical protein
MPKRLLGIDGLTGLRTYHEYDHESKQTMISYQHPDVSPVIDWAHHMADQHDRRRNIWHAATIPESIILKWRIEDGIDIFNPDHYEDLRKKLNDPAWRYLRTWHGEI